mmetsp:Transcript_20795/g.29074  ORF Transcript_20795/g.29074 Transcript_20795/m.29074 type:complete len:479 (+) Transcript_20795:369-1805(+)
MSKSRAWSSGRGKKVSEVAFERGFEQQEEVFEETRGQEFCWNGKPLTQFQLQQVHKFADLTKHTRSNESSRFPSNAPIWAISDQTTLIRFLVARKWDVASAFVQYKEMLRFRERIADKSRDFVQNQKDTYLKLKRAHKFHFLGYDQQHRPIVINRLGQINVELLSKMPTEDYVRYHVIQMETILGLCHESSRKWLSKEGKKKGEWAKQISNLTQALVVFDCKGLGLRHLSLWRKLMAIAHINDRCYPETVWKCLVLHTNVFFPFIYRLMTPLLDVATQRKIRILGESTERAALAEVVPESLLPFVCDIHCQVHDAPERGREVERSELISDSDERAKAVEKGGPRDHGDANEQKTEGKNNSYAPTSMIFDSAGIPVESSRGRLSSSENDNSHEPDGHQRCFSCARTPSSETFRVSQASHGESDICTNLLLPRGSPNTTTTTKSSFDSATVQPQMSLLLKSLRELEADVNFTEEERGGGV